jgi:hypothetical protein
MTGGVWLLRFFAILQQGKDRRKVTEEKSVPIGGINEK